MTSTKASCGHYVTAVGAPNSPARLKCESRPCPDCRDNKCRECGEVLDKDCSGQKRCPHCDPPCPQCCDQ
jgi:hypothetical protein